MDRFNHPTPLMFFLMYILDKDVSKASTFIHKYIPECLNIKYV